MKGVYTARVTFAAQTAVKNLIILRAPSTKVVKIHRAKVTNRSNETNEQMDVMVVRATGGTVGSPTSIPLKKHENGDQAASSTTDHTWTTDPTADGDPWDQQGVPSVQGYEWEPQEVDRPAVEPSGIAMLRLNTALASACDLVAELTIEEIG